MDSLSAGIVIHTNLPNAFLHKQWSMVVAQLWFGKVCVYMAIDGT
jgi:hypothetical protein